MFSLGEGILHTIVFHRALGLICSKELIWSFWRSHTATMTMIMGLTSTLVTIQKTGNWRRWLPISRACKGDICEARAKIGSSHWLTSASFPSCLESFHLILRSSRNRNSSISFQTGTSYGVTLDYFHIPKLVLCT